MTFSKEIKMQAFERAGGRCECSREKCSHNGRCQKSCISVEFFNRFKMAKGEEPVFPGFEFHHKTAVSAGGQDVLSNCEFLCNECHKNTNSYGRTR